MSCSLASLSSVRLALALLCLGLCLLCGLLRGVRLALLLDLLDGLLASRLTHIGLFVPLGVQHLESGTGIGTENGLVHRTLLLADDGAGL